MNDAQTWTTIGGMFTFMLAFMVVVVRLFGQNLDARFASVDVRLDALTLVVQEGFAQIERRFEQVDRRFDQVDRRFDQVERRLDRLEDHVAALDRDVTAITRRLMDGPDTA